MLVSSSASPRIKRYDQLSSELRQRIIGGELKPGDRLPTFIELRQKYGVSQSTLDRAHSVLELEGLIFRKRGAGTFVSEPSHSPSSNGFEAAPTKSSFLNRSVVLLTQFRKPIASHKSSGWLEWIGQGALDAIQGTQRHVISLHPDTALDELDALVHERPCGVLVAALFEEKAAYSELVKKLVAAQIPVVAYGGDPKLLGCDCVDSDHEQGAYELTKALIENGRKRILSVGPFEGDFPWFAQRYAGYKRAVEEAGLEVLPWMPMPNQKSLNSVNRLALQIALVPHPDEVTAEDDALIYEHNAKTSVGFFAGHLLGERRVDALMMPNDRTTFVAATVCRMLGLDPSHDVLITGYDNIHLECEERFFEPFVPFATVDKNNVEIGILMSQLLVEQINHDVPLGGTRNGGVSSSRHRFVSPTPLLLGA